jgi:hypothetical protein
MEGKRTNAKKADMTNTGEIVAHRFYDNILEEVITEHYLVINDKKWPIDYFVKGMDVNETSVEFDVGMLSMLDDWIKLRKDVNMIEEFLKQSSKFIKVGDEFIEKSEYISKHFSPKREELKRLENNLNEYFSKLLSG